MKKSKINEEQFIPFIEEGLRDIKKNGILSEEEFLALIEDKGGSESIYLKKNIKESNIRSHLMKSLGKISRRFIKV